MSTLCAAAVSVQLGRRVSMAAKKKKKGSAPSPVPIPSSDSAAPDAYNQETRDIILSLDHVDKKSQDGSYILKDVCLGMYMGAKIGILGKNGAGKSTVMRILAGEDEQFLGKLEMDPDISIGYLQQEPVLEEETVIECLEPTVQRLRALVKSFEDVSAQMAEPDADIDALVEQMEKLQNKIDAAGAWDIDAKLDEARRAVHLHQIHHFHHLTHMQSEERL